MCIPIGATLHCTIALENNLDHWNGATQLEA
jgi:hypothetical protein